jgi:hypothetical protein
MNCYQFLFLIFYAIFSCNFITQNNFIRGVIKQRKDEKRNPKDRKKNGIGLTPNKQFLDDQKLISSN